jgi:hypothetical protein
VYRSRVAATPISRLLVDAASLGTPTGEGVRGHWRGKGVFVSSGIDGYAAERARAIGVIEIRAARAIAWETITPEPVKAEEAWLGGVDAAHALVLLLGARYGARRDDGYSATHAEFERAQERGIPRWVFLDARVPDADRDALLRRWIEDDLRRRHSYARFDSPDSLAQRIGAKLDDSAAIEIFTWFKFGDAVLRADSDTLRAPDATGFAGAARGTFEARGAIADPDIRAYIARAHAHRRSEPLVVNGQVFDAELIAFTETSERGGSVTRRYLC